MRFRQGLITFACGLAAGIAIEKLWTAQIAAAAVTHTFFQVMERMQ